MEPDRYQKNHFLYIFGMVTLLLCLSVLFFSLYVFPFLVLGWRYDVPEFIIIWREFLISNYGVNENQATMSIFLFFSTLTLVFGLCAYFVSTRIDNAIYAIEKEKPKPLVEKIRRLRGLGFLVKVIGILILVYLSTIVFEWMIYVPPPQGAIPEGAANE